MVQQKKDGSEAKDYATQSLSGNNITLNSVKNRNQNQLALSHKQLPVSRLPNPLKDKSHAITNVRYHRPKILQSNVDSYQLSQKEMNTMFPNVISTNSGLNEKSLTRYEDSRNEDLMLAYESTKPKAKPKPSQIHSALIK